MTKGFNTCSGTQNQLEMLNANFDSCSFESIDGKSSGTAVETNLQRRIGAMYFLSIVVCTAKGRCLRHIQINSFNIEFQFPSSSLH